MSKGSKYQGVWKDGDRWNAFIDINGEQFHPGTFILEENAAIAYLMQKLKQSWKNKKIKNIFLNIEIS
ncbi:hypothetical protein [Methanobacterium sp. ACI-7]|uniref:hypothetical protein n=1 Tax=unclassified Methanobacterium TaxID=2627676 RepID=UPI0039C2A2F4